MATSSARPACESSALDYPGSDVEAAAPGEHGGRALKQGARAVGLIFAAAIVGGSAAASFQVSSSTSRRLVAVAAPAPSPDSNQWWTDVPAHLVAVVTTTQGASTTELDWFDQLTGGAGAGTALAPRATMNDGNRCSDDEEEFQNLCYKKCSTLTWGEYPIRSSAWTCCKAQPCTLFNSKHNVGVCSGFDVAGDVEGKKACPHSPGACLTNEEEHIGYCYKKCSLLAPGFPNRFGPATCCKESGLSCAYPSNSVTGPEYSVGGGYGDGDPNTPDEPHKPMVSLTESR